ncbi:uncharacterized protein LOC133796141 [Humulus lupulus]|uniref:uncharacterized protein LOC133796141 n=1 Tax=Humulus lupulus TaxID=3486 RepID=UPI002B41754A|nr:uncharacterized protein LOC133796141 [Humulus lupulus]
MAPRMHVRVHFIKVTNYFQEAELYRATTGEETQEGLILNILAPSFLPFTTNYLLNKLKYEMTQLMNELQMFDGINGGPRKGHDKKTTVATEVALGEANLASISKNNKRNKRNNKKGKTITTAKPAGGAAKSTGEKMVPSPSPPLSVSTTPLSDPAAATSVGKSCKSKACKKVFSLSHEHPMVFPDISADIVAPPSEVVVPSRSKDHSPLPFDSSLEARAKSKSVSSSSKVAAAGLLKLPLKPSQSKKNSVTPKRKLGSDASLSPLSAAKKKLKAHPPSLSSSESDPEEEKSESEATHDTTLSDETLPENAESEAESDEPEEEDIVPSEQEAESDSEKIASPLTSKAKGKKPISGSTPSPKRSGVNFKPYSSIFCYNDNARDMVLYAQRKFIIERNYVLSDHRPFGVLTMLQDRQWTGSLVKFSGFVDRIVKEFYANLTNEIIEPSSPLYNKVFVRGHWFSFSPQDIALALHLPLDVKDDVDGASLNKDMVITELVGQKMVWPSNTVISVSNLTYTYAVLHKFATTNWKPTSHTATISIDMASFLYKVGTGIGINLASVIHDQIIGFRKGNRQKKDLQRDQEDLVAPTTAASYKASAPPTEATAAPSSKKVKPQSLKIASDDIPHASSSVATDSGLVATEIAAVRASIDSLTTRVMSIEGLQRFVLEVVQSLSKDPVV